MEYAEINNAILENNFDLFERLSLSNKIDLISKLSLSIQRDLNHNEELFKKSFGAWKSDKSPNEQIEEIYKSRIFNRELLEL